MAAYPGYVYKPYPRMIYNDVWPKGYKIVNSEEEEMTEKKKVEPEKTPPVSGVSLSPVSVSIHADSGDNIKKKTKKSLKYTME
jgi:hypothetical protein